MAGHTEGLKKNQFCSVRAETCDCGNKYREPCDAEAAKWDAHPSAAQRGLKHKISQYAQKFKDGAQLRGHEAHHIACVASVTGKITGNIDIEAVVKQTKWCINDKPNMIALPMWAHTISWYVNLVNVTFEDVGPPPFAGLAQHDYDHAAYNQEVDGDLERLARAVQRKAAAHKDPAGTLAGGLSAIISEYQAQLGGRDTHGSWKKGMGDAQSDWYKAFSMSRSPSARAFPATGNRMLKKVDEVRKAFLTLFG